VTLAVVLGIGLAAVIGALTGILASPEPTPPATVAFGCPEHTIQVNAFDSVIRVIPIAPQTATVPEYHDCQRFRVAAGFGPLVAIWAAEGLPRYFLDSATSGSDSIALAVGEILDLGMGDMKTDGAGDDYAPLQLSAGFNCLYLWRSGPADQFEARIVPQRSFRELNSCVGHRVLDQALIDAPKLTVRATSFGGSHRVPVPPVARWDWDPAGRVQYIGIACGRAWCEIGPASGFTSSRSVAEDAPVAEQLAAAFEPATDAPGVTGLMRTRHLVKGWYDQQELEIWSADGKLVPSGVIGTIVPHPVLDIIHDAPTAPGQPGFAGHWEPAGYIHVTGDYNGRRLQLEKGVSRIYLCQGPASACAGAAEVGAASGTVWWSKLVAPSGHATIRAVDYQMHGGSVIPAGAARWRWLETDGTTWLRCGRGCCTDT
jgi:hypothetical protein